MDDDSKQAVRLAMLTAVMAHYPVGPWRQVEIAEALTNWIINGGELQLVEDVS